MFKISNLDLYRILLSTEAVILKIRTKLRLHKSLEETQILANLTCH